MAKWQLFKYHLKQRVCMDWVDKPQNYKDLYGILQLLRGSHLNNFPLRTLKLGRVAFHSVTFQLKCLDFQSNQNKKLVPVLSRFCNGLQGSRDGAVVRAFASHQCVPGLIPGPGVICGLSLLLVLYSAPRAFSPGTPVCPSPQKPTFLNSNGHF